MKPKPPCVFLFSARKPYFLLLLLVLLIPSIFFLRRPSSAHSPGPASPHPHRQLFLSASTNATLSAFLRSLTLLPHLSPSPSHLRLLLSLLPSSSSFLLSSSSFLPLLSYPSSLSLSLSTSTSSFPLPLSEPSLPPSVVPPYHAFSPSASLPSLLPVFVNFGLPSDYSLLSSLGVSVHGRLVLARRGPGISRAGVIRQAEALLRCFCSVRMETGAGSRGEQ